MSRQSLAVKNTGKTATQNEMTGEELVALRKRNQAAIELLDSLMNCSEEEAQEQRETFEFLRKALDEDRPSHRKLFP